MVDLPTHYDTGTATITNGSTAMVGQGTSWLSAINVGDIVMSKSQEVGIVSAVASNTSITLTRTWQGTGQTTDVYAIWFTPDATRMQETTRAALEYLANGMLEAVSGLTPTDGNIIVGDGATWVAESGATARTSLGLGTGNSPQLTGIELGHATDTTLTRASAGIVAVEGVNLLKGSVGATDNRLTRSDGTGTATVQSTGITVDDSNNVTGVVAMTTTGRITSGTGVSIGTDTFAAARHYYDATFGLVVGGKTGSTSDLLLTNNSGSQALDIPTGTAGIRVYSLLTLSGGQAKWPAAQSASADVNTLDDYEEGTFTPTIVGTGTAGAGTYSVQLGAYTKIGRKVTASGTLTWSAHTGTTNMKIGGLPFTNATGAAYEAAVRIYYSNLTFAGPVVGYVDSAGTTITLETVATGAASTALPIDAAATIKFEVTYFV